MGPIMAGRSSSRKEWRMMKALEPQGQHDGRIATRMDPCNAIRREQSSMIFLRRPTSPPRARLQLFSSPAGPTARLDMLAVDDAGLRDRWCSEHALLHAGRSGYEERVCEAALKRPRLIGRFPTHVSRSLPLAVKTLQYLPTTRPSPGVNRLAMDASVEESVPGSCASALHRSFILARCKDVANGFLYITCIRLDVVPATTAMVKHSHLFLSQEGPL